MRDEPQASQPTPEPEFINVQQLLERLPISRRTLYAHRASGKIPYVQLGDRVLFHWGTVKEALLRQQGTNAVNSR
jgi:excisionase family DNA binding protein